MENKDNIYRLSIIIDILQWLVAEIIYINFTLDDKIKDRAVVLPKISQSLLLPIRNIQNLKMINIRIFFLLFGVCIEDICQLLKPHSKKDWGKGFPKNFLSQYDYERREEIIKIYTIYNVFKHSKGIIDKNEPSGKFLIKNYSMLDGEDLSGDKNLIYLIDYAADVYKGLENLILIFGEIDQASLIMPIDNLKSRADNNLDICKELLRKALYIEE